MIVHRIPNALLNDVAMISHHYQSIREHKHKDDMEKFGEETKWLLAVQEQQRILRNYNYRKDTEAINLYCALESEHENSLYRSAQYTGLHVDRYI